MPFSILQRNDDQSIRIGVIGVGESGSSHLEGLLARPDVAVPTICDINAKNATRAQRMVTMAAQEASALYTRGETDFNRLVARNDLDAVLIAQGEAPVEFPDFTDGNWMTNDRVFATDREY